MGTIYSKSLAFLYVICQTVLKHLRYKIKSTNEEIDHCENLPNSKRAVNLKKN